MEAPGRDMDTLYAHAARNSKRKLTVYPVADCDGTALTLVPVICGRWSVIEKLVFFLGNEWSGEASISSCYNSSPRANHVKLGQSCAAVAQRKRRSAAESRAAGSSVGGSGQSRWITNRRQRSSALWQEADNHVSCSTRANRRSATGALGEVESS